MASTGSVGVRDDETLTVIMDFTKRRIASSGIGKASGQRGRHMGTIQHGCLKVVQKENSAI